MDSTKPTKPKRMSECHPDRPHYAKGKCKQCAHQAWKKSQPKPVLASEIKEIVDVPRIVAPKGAAVKAAAINYRDPKVAGYVAGKLVKNMLDTKKTVEELVPEATPAQKAETAEALDTAPQIQEAVKERLEIDGLDGHSQKKFVTLMWAWLEGADPGKAKEAAKLLGKHFISTGSDKGKPVDLPIAGIKEGLDKMLGDANPLAKHAVKQVKDAMESEAS